MNLSNRFLSIRIPVALLFTLGMAIAQTDPDGDLPVISVNGPHPSGSTSISLRVTAAPGDYRILTSSSLSGAWTEELTVSVMAGNGADFVLPIDGRITIFVRAQQPDAGEEVIFRTEGSTFEPEILCLENGQPTVLWTWDDGTTSSDYPIVFKDFGPPATRSQRLVVDTSNPLIAINIGFDGALEGDTSTLNHRPQQNVSAVTFPKPLTSLRYWASSHNPIANTLDFTGFVSLKSIECYQNAQLQEIVVSNLPELERLVVEGCNLQQLDLSNLPNLVDLRCARNAFTNITLGDGTGPNVRHWISRGNPQLTQSFKDVMTNFYSLQNFWTWNNNQRGALSFVSTNLISLRAYRNEYTDLNLTNHPNLESVWMHENQLTNVTLGGNSSLLRFIVRDNRLTTEHVDQILGVLNDSAPDIYEVDLTLNAERPSLVGYGHYWNMVSRGVAVFVDWPEANDGKINEPGGSQAITFVTTGSNPQLEIRIESTTPANVTWHWGDGTVTQGPTVVSHFFGTAGVYTNYVEVDPPDAVTYFGAPRRLPAQGISAVDGLANFPNLNFLYLFREQIEELSLAGCASLRQIHLARNPVSSSVVDQWFIDLDQAVSGPVTDADFWYPPDLRTPASDAAWNSLIEKGYIMRPFPEANSDPDPDIEL